MHAAMEFLSVLLFLLSMECGIVLSSVYSVEEELTVLPRAKRDADIELPLNISFTVNAYDAGTCYGGTSAGLGSTDLRLEYRNNASGFQWVEIAGNITIGGNFSTAVNIPGSGCVVVRLVQEEHGGGNCNCWEVTSITLNSFGKNIIVPAQTKLNDEFRSRQCGGAASVPRSVEWPLVSDAASDCNVTSAILTKPFNTTCLESSSYINITFQLIFENDSCNGIDFFDEGVEFSIQINSIGAWIPITLAFKNFTQVKDRKFVIGKRIDEDNVVIRGFRVESNLGSIDFSYYSVKVCDFAVPVNSIQFRWLQTSNTNARSEVWALDNVHVSHHNNNVSITLLQDLFDDPDQLNTANWSPSNFRNGNVSTMCAATETNNSALVFGLNSGSGLVSRSVKTGIIPVNTTVATTMAATTDDVITTAPPTTMAVTTGDVITTAPPTTMAATTDDVITTVLPTTMATTTDDVITTALPTTMATTTDDVITTALPTTMATTTYDVKTTALPTTMATTTDDVITTAMATTADDVITTAMATATDDVLTTAVATTIDDVITTAPPTMPGTTMPLITATSTTMATTSEDDITRELLVTAVREVEKKITEDQVLLNITTLPPAQALDELAAVVSDDERDDDKVVVIYLLGSILNRTTGEFTIPTEDFLSVGTGILESSQNIENEAGSVDEFNVVGSSLLAVMDDFAFNHFDQENNTSLGNIALQTRQLTSDSVGQEDLITAIDSSDFPSFSHAMMSIEIPPDLVGMFSNMSGMGSNGVRLGSFLYANVTGLFSSSLPGEIDTKLASGIVSTALQCGTGRCPTDDLQLDTPVRITIGHTETVKEQLESSNSTFKLEIQCVFLDLSTEEDDGILSAGQWSERGCNRSESLSNTSVTVCECDHLTHFAILLSAAPLNLSDAVVSSLEVIGYVGVSVSLVAMGLTIFTFVVFKSLHNMRNYIHINLCISLGIAQLIFVAGVDQSASDHVPIHCQVIAVLLHYFFLVSFMWMLMEGVVLYVALVRVFVKNKKRYLLAFTLASYGIPLLYLGLLTLPLGFALPTQPDYGYNNGCFLNTETNFIWAFIAPVIVIIVINVGFFIMAATIMWRHQKKQSKDSNLHTFKNWLKSAVSLVVIMGLTWILGVLIVEVKELVPLAYIYTIMVAFQGLFIFLIFILLSNKVREAYTKFWKTKVNESDILSKYFGEKTFFTANRSTSTSNKEATAEISKQDESKSDMTDWKKESFD